MGLLPLESILVFDAASFLSGLGVLIFGYRLNRIVPLHLMYFGMPVYVVGAFITWYGAIALIEDIYGLTVIHVDLQSLLMAIIGTMLASMLYSFLSYARKSTGEKPLT